MASRPAASIAQVCGSRTAAARGRFCGSALKPAICRPRKLPTTFSPVSLSKVIGSLSQWLSRAQTARFLRRLS